MRRDTNGHASPLVSVGLHVARIVPARCPGGCPIDLVRPGSPSSTVAGKISATGTYTDPVGYDIVNITMYASPSGGGQGGQVNCNFQNLNWDGTITGLTSGSTYNVFARLTAFNTNTSQVEYYDTPTKQVKVK